MIFEEREQLAPSDKVRLWQLFDDSPKGWDMQKLEQELRDRTKSAIAITGVNCDLLVIYGVEDYPKGRELQVYAMVGMGLQANLQDVVWFFDTVARRLNCNWVAMESHRTGWDRFFEAVAKPVTKIWIRAIK